MTAFLCENEAKTFILWQKASHKIKDELCFFVEEKAITACRSCKEATIRVVIFVLF